MFYIYFLLGLLSLISLGCQGIATRSARRDILESGVLDKSLTENIDQAPLKNHQPRKIDCTSASVRLPSATNDLVIVGPRSVSQDLGLPVSLRPTVTPNVWPVRLRFAVGNWEPVESFSSETISASRPFRLLGQDGFDDLEPETAEPESLTPISPLLPVTGLESTNLASEGMTPLLPLETEVNSDWVLPSYWEREQQADRSEHSFVQRVVGDYQHFYSTKSLQFLGVGFVIGGAMANTEADVESFEWLHDPFQRPDNERWRRLLHGSKDLGDGRYTLPVFAGCYAAGQLLEDVHGMETVGQWGERSLRGFIVGAPFVAATQLATGAGRPGEREDAQHWKPLSDDNGVSGHAFMGALPILTAAMMAEDLRLKTGLYLASWVTPLSRISDGAHYPSQVLLGWCAAYAAARAVAQTDSPDREIEVLPYFSQEGDSGLLFQWDF